MEQEPLSYWQYVTYSLILYGIYLYVLYENFLNPFVEVPYYSAPDGNGKVTKKNYSSYVKGKPIKELFIFCAVVPLILTAIIYLHR
jgi:hypothetical protein